MDIETISVQNTTPEPHLVQIGNTFYLLVDSEFAILSDSFLSSFDILFKSFFIFNIKFPKGLTKFYQFLESFIYKSQTTATGSTLEKLYSNLKS